MVRERPYPAYALQSAASAGSAAGALSYRQDIRPALGHPYQPAAGLLLCTRLHQTPTPCLTITHECETC